MFLLICYRAADSAHRERKAELYLSKIEWASSMAKAEKEWIRKRQGEDGRLHMSEGEDTNPYFACLGAQGLLSGQVSEADLDTVRRYLAWHGRKFEESNGEIPDFRIMDGVESATKPDSVDAYIAVFLSLICQKAEITGELSGQEREAIELGMQKLDDLTVDGLTLVREGDSRFYLMDNIEVLACYQDIQRLHASLDGLEEIAQEAGRREERAREIISAKLWNPEAFRYEVGIQTGGDTIEAGELDKFYPDGVVQVYGAAFGQYFTDGDNTEKLYERFCDTFPWETMEMEEVSFYWSELAMAAIQAGDLERVETYLKTYEKRMKTDRSYPLHIGTAGWVAKTCARMENIYREQMESSLLQDIIKKMMRGESDGWR